MTHIFLSLFERCSKSETGLPSWATESTQEMAVPGSGVSSGWNASTMCIRRIHRSMVADGWSRRVEQPPLAQCPAEDLPRRPLDLGEGLWR